MCRGTMPKLTPSGQVANYPARHNGSTQHAVALAMFFFLGGGKNRMITTSTHATFGKVNSLPTTLALMVSLLRHQHTLSSQMATVYTTCVATSGNGHRGVLKSTADQAHQNNTLKILKGPNCLKADPTCVTQATATVTVSRLAQVLHPTPRRLIKAFG